MDQNIAFTQSNRRSQALHERSPITSTQAPWTAARCNRLLRPISSRIALLRKRGNREVYSAQDTYDETAKRLLLGGSRESVSLKFFGFARTGTHDPDWAPSPRPQKKTKRTYSTKHGNQISSYVAGGGPTHGSERGSNMSLEIPANAIRGDIEHQAFGIFNNVADCTDVCSTADMLDSELRKGKLIARRRFSHPQPRETLRQLAKSVSPAHWMLVDGLYSGFDALLKATSRSTEVHNSGTRSLLSTCLRRVPGYINEEQSLYDEQNPDDNTSISSIVYANLEAFGHSDIGGWKQLREVVRAHGVAMLGTAVEEDLMTFSVARGLVILCLHASAYDEAQYIIQAMVRSMESHIESRAIAWDFNEKKIRATLSILDHFVTTTGRSGFQYSTLASMLGRGVLSTGWISSRASIKYWNAVIREVSQQGLYSQEAGLLIRTAALLSYHGRRLCITLSIHDLRLYSREDIFGDTLDTDNMAEPVLPPLGTVNKGPGFNTIAKDSCATISSLLTVLTSICILNSTEPMDMISQQPTLRTLQDIAQEAQKASIFLAPRSCEKLQHGEKFELIAIAILAAALARTSALKECLDRVIPSSIDHDAIAILVCLNDDISDCLGSFIDSVAQCCARATNNDPFKYLQDLVRQLSEFAKIETVDLEVRKLFARSALAAAFQYSEKTGESRHLEWALDIQRSVKDLFGEAAHRCAEQTPAQSSKNKNGYRWEEGICEWVTKTPGTLWPQPDQQKEQELTESSRDEDTGMEEPYLSSLPQNTCLSEISPCFPVRPVTFRMRQQRRRQNPDTDATLSFLSEDVPANRVHKPWRRVSHNCQETKGSRKRMFQSIYVDEDADELSTPESSQKSVSATNEWLGELKNVAVKPRRQVHHASKLPRSRGTSSSIVQAASFKTYQAARDTVAAESYSEDELGV